MNISGIVTSVGVAVVTVEIGRIVIIIVLIAVTT